MYKTLKDCLHFHEVKTLKSKVKTRQNASLGFVLQNNEFALRARFSHNIYNYKVGYTHLFKTLDPPLRTVPACDRFYV